MKKIISLLGCCFIAISTLTACENNNLPAWADTDVLTPKAQTMIDTLNAFDYDGVAEIYNNPAVDASTFEASGEIIETYGTFESYGNVSYVLRIVWIRRVGTSTDAGARLIQSQHRHLVRELYKKFYPCPAAHRLPSSITRRSASSLRRQASLIRAHSSLS